MAVLGFANLVNNTLPTLWNQAEMERIRLADGATFDSVAQEIQDALGELNSALLEDLQYGGLFSVQDNVEVGYHVGGSKGVQLATEYGVPDPGKGQVTGHSIPLHPWWTGAGWTLLGIGDRTRMQIEADVRLTISDVHDHFQQRALRRFFRSTAEAVGTTAGASVPFADGGTADANYVPPKSNKGKSFANTHDHFLRVSALSNTNVDAAILHVQEHGHMGPFEAIVPEADVSSWQALTNFKKPEWAGIVYGNGTERASLDNVETYVGYYESPYGICRLWSTPRLPTNYFGVYKSYGAGDMRNPLRMRIDPNFGYGWRIVPGTWVNSPSLLAVCMAKYEFGIGQDRANGVCVYIAGSGDYADPTIS